ncbi:MAG: glucose-6-phosphate dehydrogenase [Candidatus Cyclobacteriaceae bacterium M3_2C_046]
MKVPDNQILVIFGASGDLTERKLIPAIYNLKKQKLLPSRFAILGVGRTEFSDAAFREKMMQGIKKYLQEDQEAMVDTFCQEIYYLSIDTKSAADYEKLKLRLKSLDRELQTEDNYIFYLATPPSLYPVVPKNLAIHGLNKSDNGGFRRLIVEKPFGYDLQSGRSLNNELQKVFEEDQIYRIDHYLGKETVQNILVTRFSNNIFEPLWNQHHIHHVEITSAESLGVENRGGYYDESGALRDMFQNHLLKLVSLVAMEPPTSFNAKSIRNETIKVLESLRPLKESEVGSHVIRGQYTDSIIRGEKVPSYREEKGVNSKSKTETYLALKFFIDNWRWGGVPFYVRTGKRMPTTVTEIVIHFKPTPHHLFARERDIHTVSNALVIRIQPDEGILLKFGMKVPGAGFKVQDVAMDFHYKDLAHSYLPTAYERLLLDSMLGDATLYERGDAVEAAWQFVDPVLKVWQSNPKVKIYGYPAGTWGPPQADDLIEEPHLTWRYPCKNLAMDGVYCEL